MAKTDSKNVKKNKGNNDNKEKKQDREPKRDDRKDERKVKQAGSEGIVRIVDTDVSASVPISRSLGDIKGMGIRYNALIARIFENKTKVEPSTQIGKLTDEQILILEDIIKDPVKYKIPKWFVNKPVDIWDGSQKHLLGSELLFNDKEELDRLGKIKHRKALRRVRGLPVRGQRTKSGFRHRRKAVGVVKR